MDDSETLPLLLEESGGDNKRGRMLGLLTLLGCTQT
jgi:hypothetical protein